MPRIGAVPKFLGCRNCRLEFYVMTYDDNLSNLSSCNHHPLEGKKRGVDWAWHICCLLWNHDRCPVLVTTGCRLMVDIPFTLQTLNGKLARNFLCGSIWICLPK